MPKALLRDIDWHAAGERVTRVSRVQVPHPICACLRQTLNPLHIALPRSTSAQLLKKAYTWS